MAFAGLDRHKRFCQTIIGIHERKVLREERILTDKEDIDRGVRPEECI
jgi:hypothetical protein